jgi:hypothetical protein
MFRAIAGNITHMLEGYAEAAQAVSGLVGRIPDDAWHGHGLGEWDLRALVGHTSRSFVTVLTYLERPADTEDIDSPEGYYALLPSMTGEGLDQAAVAQRGRDAGAALGDDPDALISSIAGGLRVASYVPTRTVELVVHGHDIAAATGLEVAFTEHTVTQVATVLARTGVRLGQGRALLDALTGRAPLPPGFSGV